MFTVKFRRSVAATGPLMADMRLWLDKGRVVPEAFHCRPAPHGVEIEITFGTEDDARRCEEHFEGLSLIDG
jgi:hypothetical protein